MKMVSASICESESSSLSHVPSNKCVLYTHKNEVQ